ncbi:hypothetical protein ZHAS_00005596 [Anopheles sinensis]|uniref:Uncharacterized protein n=1 Tax=Anopheles sinensis TaxID=74873 RepID=A0A084VJU8_ANOSI|nr:hypothetical protein ZHAS_00005596 [Anopheles sinensis]
MSSQMGHFLGPDDSSEIEPFDPEALQYRGSTTSGTPSAAGRKVKQNPVIVSGSGAGTSNGRNGSRSNQKTSPHTPKQKTRDSDCCSINFIKYSLHIFNTMFLMPPTK